MRFLLLAALLLAFGIVRQDTLEVRKAEDVARVGLGLKETVVAVERLQPVYGNDPEEAVRLEAGVDAEVRVERALMENALLRSRLGLFQWPLADAAVA